MGLLAVADGIQDSHDYTHESARDFLDRYYTEMVDAEVGYATNLCGNTALPTTISTDC